MPHDATVEYSQEVTQEQLKVLSVSFSYSDDLDHVHWACPRCRATFDQSFSRDDPIYQFDIKTVDAPEGTGVLDLVCKCGVTHKGGDDKPGCGFAAQLPVEGA